MGAVADWIYNPRNDRIVAQAIGLILSGALILLYVGLRLTPSKIGA